MNIWRRPALAAILGVSLVVGLMPAPAARGSDTVTRWQHFSEASSCGSAYTKTPYASRKGSLPDSQQVLGPFGSYFGRTIDQVRSRLVWWDVPFSGGQRVKVHRAAYPAFQRVAQRLAEEAAEGRIYPIETVSAFVPRTLGGSHQISRHALGTAIDFNYRQNPYRGDGKLITDMPSWFVDAWRDSGFCWGGDWRFSKDAMHFSWMGPDGSSFPPEAPLTATRLFGDADETLPTVLGPVLDRYSVMIGDGTGNGAPDVLGLRPHSNGAVVDMASGSEGFGSCSVRRWFMPDDWMLGSDHVLMADVDGDARNDLLALRDDGSGVTLGVARHREQFSPVRASAVPLDGGVAAAAGADFDGDHIADLWAVSSDGELTVLQGPEFGDVLHSSMLPSGAPVHLAASDRDGGDIPELFAVYGDGDGSRLEVMRLASSSWEAEQTIAIGGDILAVGAADYDGEGRADFQALRSDGRLDSYLGNTSTAAGPSSWFVNPDFDCRSPIVLDFSGSFFDDDQSVHQRGIEWIAGKGITAGCNPPYNDRFCPGSTLTRAQAAAFVARAIGLGTPETDHFVDDDGHVLESAIDRIAEAGITNGCDPANKRFCPNRHMTRAEFATFLARSLNLAPSGTDHFVDDDGHILEGAINRLASAGITKGCNPPANDRFCPDRHLSRAETATFITRAFG